jgi:hypothetical protein
LGSELSNHSMDKGRSLAYQYIRTSLELSCTTPLARRARERREDKRRQRERERDRSRRQQWLDEASKGIALIHHSFHSFMAGLRRLQGLVDGSMRSFWRLPLDITLSSYRARLLHRQLHPSNSGPSLVWLLISMCQHH